MEVTVLNTPPNSTSIEIQAIPPTVQISFGYAGPPFKTLIAGENITLDETSTDITINAPVQPIERLLKTGNHVLVLTDAYKLIDMNVAGNNTITVPPNASVAFDIGTAILISQYGAGQTEILEGSGVTIRSEAGYKKIYAQYCGAVLIKIGTNEWYLQGALAA
jgi:hypothetical protein